MLRNFVALEEGRFGRTEGQGLVEYALIIALIAVAVVGSLISLRTALGGYYDTIATALPAL